MRVLGLALWLAALLLFPEVSAAVSEVEPNDSFDDATPVSCGTSLSASIGFAGDTDFYRLTGIPANTILHADISSPGTCFAGSNPGGACTSIGECPGGFCLKSVDLVLTGYTADRELRLIVDDTGTDTDPITTIPLENPAATEGFLEVSGLANATGSYTLLIFCDQPQDVTCPTSASGVTSVFGNDPEGDMDVFRLTLTDAKNLILDIDAEGILFGDLKTSSFDAFMRLYDPSWTIISEVDFGCGPLEIECPLTDELDSYISTHVFEPGFYYVAVTCSSDFEFFGCPVGPDDPTKNDFEYSLRRHCRSVSSLSTLDCVPGGTSVSDELRELTFRVGVEVDFYDFQATEGDLIEVDIDVTDPNSFLDSVVGLFQPTGPYLDGIRLVWDDYPTCEIDTEACNDADSAPGDPPPVGFGDSYLTFCAPETGTALVGVSNAVDLDFNGLDDDFPEDLEFIKDFIGPYEMTLRCTRPDSDGDTATDCLDVCPSDAEDDLDEDGICVGVGFHAPKIGHRDNCPMLSNESQLDTDFDGLGDLCDICPKVVDPNQLDTDLNGIGDECQCGDVTGDGFTNVSDALGIARGEVNASSPNFSKCDVNGDTFCHVADALIIARGQLSPAPEDQLCPAYQGL